MAAKCTTKAPGEWLHLAKIAALRDFGSQKKLTALCEAGVFRGKKVGASWFLHQSEVDRILAPQANPETINP